jgi:hypothetical protein
MPSTDYQLAPEPLAALDLLDYGDRREGEVLLVARRGRADGGCPPHRQGARHGRAIRRKTAARSAGRARVRS